MKYQKSSHTTYDVRYHLVWITKYRKKVLTKEIQEKLEEILEKICDNIGIVIIKLGFEEDYIHMHIRIPLNKSISESVGYIKGKSSYILKKEFYKHFRKAYWSVDNIWSVGYFISSVGEINGDIIARYVEEQGK